MSATTFVRWVSYFIIFLIVGLGIIARFLETHCISKDKTVITLGILFIAPIKHHGKKQQNLSKFEVGFELHAQAADLRLRW